VGAGLDESNNGWQDFVGERNLLHLRFGWGDRTMAESITQDNHDQLQHDDKVIALCGNRGKRLAYVWQVEWGGWFPEHIWKIGVRTTLVRCSEIGTAHYTRKVVGYTPTEFWGLVGMHKDDAPMIWETSGVANRQVWQMGWSTSTPREMDQGL